MKKSLKHNIELLAPAKNADIALVAIRYGADAVYIGADAFGARSEAKNSVSDIAKVVDYARQFRAKVYVTINTIIYKNELNKVRSLIIDLYNIGVDALIVQDMSLLRMDLPPIAFHASTQCDIRTPDRARFLQDVGFSQLVLPREMSLEEIAAVKAVTDVPLEAFVHGALCVSYSGDCYASQIMKGRSANRGECAQLCRLPYDLYDGDGLRIVEKRHLLSLKDLNQSSRLAAMLEAGVSSFKIEGRLKDMDYVKNVVAAYSKKIDAIIQENPERYSRTSFGNSVHHFTPSLTKSFNRGFTHYFLDDRDKSIASIYTPKSQGEKVGVVKAVKNGVVVADILKPLANGDGIIVCDPKRDTVGFRLNKIEGNRIFPASKVDLLPGDVLYRNYDKQFDDILKKDTTDRKIAIKITLRKCSESLVVADASDERGNSVTSTLTVERMQPSQKPQEPVQESIMSKLGATVYRLSYFKSHMPDVFVPVSQLAELRRRVVNALDCANKISYPLELRRVEDVSAAFPGGKNVSYHENVANPLAESFYRSHGVERIEKAVEVDVPKDKRGMVVMSTRYCVRKELGICLKTPEGRRVPEPMTLQSGAMAFSLEFDCRNCGMKVRHK